MPNPFPGMNPYLEDPISWPTVHSGLIGFFWRAINRQLPPGFVANMEERIVVEEVERSFYPDVMVTREPFSPANGQNGGGVALLDAPFVVEAAEERREPFLEIRTAKGAELVTVIEVLSPANKVAPGREAYKTKQRTLLRSETHLLEIDLLRAGDYTLAAPAVQLLERPHHFLTCLHRAGGHRFEMWPSLLTSRLPRVAVPLSAGAGDIAIDLQEGINAVYEDGLFDRRLNYEAEPIPPLSPEDAAWADELLRAAGKRPGKL